MKQGREGGFLEKTWAFRIKTPGYHSLKQPVLLKNDLAHQVALMPAASGNSYSPRVTGLMALLLSRLAAYFASVTFSTGVFAPVLVLSLRALYPKSVAITTFPAQVLLHITLFIAKSC